MELWSPVIFEIAKPQTKYSIDDEESSFPKDEEEFSFDFFYTDEATIKGDGAAIEAELDRKAKKNTKKNVSASEVPASVLNKNNQNSMTENTNSPYLNTYGETDNLIRGTILQIDQLNSEIKTDIDKIRASSSMKGKYTYLTNLTSASSSLLATRLNAIRELNNTITQSHNLELKRAKDLKEYEKDKQNDDARMMDLYSAFINAPMGMYDNKLNMPTIPDMMIGVNDPNSGISGMSMSGGFNNNTISPEQMRMRMEGNNNIEEVVVFDPATGRKWFDVIDKSTGQSVPNYPRSDAFMLEDISVETRAGIAKNRNLDRVWPLQVVGSSNLSEY